MPNALNVVVAEPLRNNDALVRIQELTLHIADFQWLVTTVGGYLTEEDFRTFFLLPIVDLLAADQQYPNEHAGKRVDIRQIYWIILLLIMFSTTSGWRISSPPTHCRTSVWYYRTARRCAEVILVIYKILNLNSLGSNPIFPRELPPDCGNFRWYANANAYNPRFPLKNILSEDVGQQVDAYLIVQEIASAIVGSTETEMRKTNGIFKRSISGRNFIGSIEYNRHHFELWNQQYNLDNNIEAYVEPRPHIIVTLLRRFEDLARLMNNSRHASNFNNGEQPDFVPLLWRYVRNNNNNMVNVAVAANNAMVQGNNLLAAGLNQIQANVAVNANNFANAAVGLLPPGLQGPANPQIVRILQQREEQVAAQNLVVHNNLRNMINIVTQSFNNDILPLLLNPLPLPYIAPQRNHSVQNALTRNNNVQVNSIETLLNLPVFHFSSENQKAIAINVLTDNFVTFEGVIEMFENNWTANDNFQTRLQACRIPPALTLILLNGMNLLIS